MTLIDKIQSISAKWYETAKDAQDRLKDKIRFKARLPMMDRQYFVRNSPPLIYNGVNDYMLKEEQDSAWIDVDDNLVYIRRTTKGVAVEIIAVDSNGCLETIAECFAERKPK